MSDTEKVMAVAKEVGIGMRDCADPVLWFTVYISESVASLQVIRDWDEVKRILRTTRVYDVKQLEGRPCWVERDGTMILFRSFWRNP